MHTRNHILSLVFALSALLVCAVSWAGPFRNITNQPFATRCNGPQGAIVIADDAVSAASARVASLQAPGQLAKLAHARATVGRLQRLGLVNPRSKVRMPRLAVHMQQGKLVLPDLVHAAAVGDLGDPANQITFQYEGWSEPDRLTLQSYLSTAYPKARLIYGPPAFNITVKVIQDSSINDLQGGIYDASTNEIRMAPLTGNVPEDTFVLMLLVLRAFHDDVSFFYDAWEEGFVGAAATAVQVQPGISPDFDPKDPGPFYALSVYEAENHPALGNSTFYPEGNFGGMFVWRVAMARAAWMKCWIEDNSFFSKFNQQYYAQFSDGLQGDVLGLREIAATALPMVEGLPFQEWYQRQWVLDTSVRTGLKEYTWNIPLDTAVVLIVEHYLTDEYGNESFRGGQARTIYWSFDFTVNLYAEEGNLIDIPVSGDTPGEGFLIPTFFNIGGAQRITVQLDLNGLQNFYPFPFSVRGFEPGENNLYGGIINETRGEIDVTGGDGISDLVVKRGIWGGQVVIGQLSPTKAEVTFTNSDGDIVKRQVNVGWDSYMVLIDGGTQTTANFTFTRGLNGLHMMSLPITPVNGSAPGALGISPADFLLAHWDPASLPDGRYRIWPDCEPFAPGRGFWLRVLSDVAGSLAGIKQPDENRITVPLELGWNMFGSVRLDVLPTEGLKVQVGTQTPVLLAEAVSKRYVQAGIFGYSQTGGYELVEEVEPFKGYWIRCLAPAGCRLVFEPVQLASASVASSGKASLTPQWRLPITVRSGQFASSAAYLGGAPDATAGHDLRYDLTAPPAFGPYVSARFVSEGSDARYVTDVRPADARDQVWTLEVTSTETGEPIHIAWPDMSQMPADLRPVLVDAAAGKRVYMRTSPGYTVPAGASQTSRTLQIEMSGPQTGPLVVSSMAASPGRGGVTVAYTLSHDASVQTRVLNIAGRPVRSISSGQVQPAGVNSVVWTLSDDRGTKVPNGLYLVELQARDETGQSVRAVRTVRVDRP